MKTLGIYLHIPFCAKKCHYCDFLSFDGTDERTRTLYAEALIREIRNVAGAYADRFVVDSVFFGGGAPSFPPASMVTDAVAALRSSFNFARSVEMTVEANPGTLDEGKLHAYLRAGVNRLSMGAQSMNETLLRRLGRSHGGEDIFRCYDMARRSGFKNINIDMIFAIPGQSLAEWEADISEAAALGSDHISFYAMQIEKGTPLYRQCLRGELRPVSEETDRRMYRGAVGALEKNGFQRYEISNAAKPGMRCAHNLKYWSMNDYLGLGLGAHSFVDGVRASNKRSLAAYLSAETSLDFRARKHVNTERDSVSEFIFLGMRRSGGISAAAFRERFGRDFFEMFADEIERLLAQGLIEISGAQKIFALPQSGSGTSGSMIRLTERGFDLADTVFAEFV